MIRFRPPLLVPAPVLALQQPYPVRYPRPVPLQPLVLRVSTAQYVLAGQLRHPCIPRCFSDRLEPRRVSTFGQDDDEGLELVTGQRRGEVVMAQAGPDAGDDGDREPLRARDKGCAGGGGHPGSAPAGGIKSVIKSGPFATLSRWGHPNGSPSGASPHPSPCSYMRAMKRSRSYVAWFSPPASRQSS